MHKNIMSPTVFHARMNQINLETKKHFIPLGLRMSSRIFLRCFEHLIMNCNYRIEIKVVLFLLIFVRN